MLTKRVIPCLDVDAGRVVKSIRFLNTRDAGDPVELATLYNKEGADELVFYDITASVDQRSIMLDVVKKVSEQVFIPLTIGGGLRTVDDMHRMLLAGADKVSLNTAAVQNPQIVSEGAKRFGNQCIVVGMDTRKLEAPTTGSPDVPKEIRLDPASRWEIRTHSGRGGGRFTGVDAVKWAKYVTDLGAGELCVNSMDADGTQDGYDLEVTKAISEVVRVPVIASGGAGKLEHFYEAIDKGKADAVLAASLFHFGTLRIADVKRYLSDKGMPIRLN